MDVKVLANIRKTCRTCLRVLESRKDLISMFDIDQTYPLKKLKISEMLASITNLTPLDYDVLPKRICITCVCQVRSAFFFKSQAENAHKVLEKQLRASSGLEANQIKKETSITISDDTKIKNVHPEVNVSTSGTENADADTFVDDMLVEIEPPKIQEHFNGHTEENEEEEESDGHEIGDDFEPYSDNDDVEMIEDPQFSKADNGKSPDSGISDEFNKLFSAQFNERQLAESELGDFRQFVCNFCHKQMISYKALLRHKRNYHSVNKCNYCRKKVSNRFQLKVHVQHKHPQKFQEFQLNGQTNPIVSVEPIMSIPECGSCGAKFCELNAVRRHRADCDKKCNECGLKIPQKNLYFIHYETQHNIKLEDPPIFECPFGCIDKFISEKILQDHIQRCHPEDKESVAGTISEDNESVSSESSFECEFCHHRFPKQKSLNHHIAIMHKGIPKEQPKTKNQPKYTRDEFVDKFMASKSNDTQRCIPCKKDIHRNSLMIHLKGKHASMKSFLCEFCHEGFFRPDYRLRHMNYIHPTQYRCTRCHVQFDRAYKYDAHMNKHGVKAKNFKPDEHLDRYDLPTTNMKYIEDTSTYDYSSKQDMQRRPSSTQTEILLTREDFMERYITNTSVTQSQCTICQQKMMKSSILTHLLWKHALKKPLKCAFCNERVVKANARLNHMARCHPSEYKCKDCGEQFAKHAELAQHMLRNHTKRLMTSPSVGEEPDIALNDVRFVSQNNDEEIIEETEMICLEPDVRPNLVKALEAAVREPGMTQFKCRICGDQTFANAKNLAIHNSHKHRGCDTSKQTLDNSTDPMPFEEFRYHFCENTSDRNVKCLVCDQTLKKKNFTNHAKARHATTGAFKCAVCPEDFFRPEHRIQHMSQSHRGMFFCQTCSIQFYRNSRYAKHMKDLHEIEIEDTDEYEVDVCLLELKFVPFIKKYQEDNLNVVVPSIVHEPEVEEEEEEEEVKEKEKEAAPGNELSRDEFLSTYIKIVNKDTRRCIACDKTMQKKSMYHHLMRYHATTPAFKCPFCDLRMERAPIRIRHLQIFHADEYKCQTCGTQFQKHASYVEHMMIEHNEVVRTSKAEGEEKDLSSLDLKYLPYLSREDSYWQEHENSMTETSKPRGASTPLPSETTFLKPSISDSSYSQKDGNFFKPQIKQEPKDIDYSLEHSIFGNNHPSVEDWPKETSKRTEYSYSDFKSRFLAPFDYHYVKCKVCAKKVLKTSVSAHMRLHHAITLCYNCELCPQGFQRSDYRARHMKLSHEDDFRCDYCDTQFHRSVLYKDHMKNFHKMNFDVPELKKKEEIDVPLENMKFVEHLPDEMKVIEGEPIKKWKRVKLAQPPINPEAGGLTFKEFMSTYITTTDESLNCKVCGPTTIFSKYNLKKHMKRCHATTQPFFCELCSEGFQKLDDRMQHMATVHEDDFKCVHCNEQFYMSIDYVEHMKEVHRVTITMQAAKKRSEIDVPFERLRFVAEKLCEDISIKTSAGIMRSNKETYDHIPDDAELTRQQFFGKFFRTIKGKGKTKCLACAKIFSSNNRIFHALHNHCLSRPYNCEKCPKSFFLKIKRLRHMSFKHYDDYKCTECSLQFDRAKLYAEHMEKQHEVTVEIPTLNDDAIDVPPSLMKFTKKLTAVKALKQEVMMMKLKDDEGNTSSSPLFTQGPVECNDCHEEFDSSRAYRNHLRNQLCGVPSEVKKIEPPKVESHVEYNFECDICEKKFSASYALNAHRKFKHFRNTSENTVLFSKKIKFTVHCEICDFVAPRRDCLERHVKKEHKPEFKCRHCERTSSNFNYYMHHVHDNHPKALEKIQTSHKCSECQKGFRSVDILEMHKKNKHGHGFFLPENFCLACGVAYKSAENLEIHNKNIYHLALVKYLNNPAAHVPEHSRTVKQIKPEPLETEAMNVKTQEDDSKNDPIERMLIRKLRSSNEPPAKRSRHYSPSTKIEEPSTADETTLMSVTDEASTVDEAINETPTIDKHRDEPKVDENINDTPIADEAMEKDLTDEEPSSTTAASNYDNLEYEYLKYLQCSDGVYKCAICGKTKKLRKYMLHHLKQHEEVTTYGCSQCPEKFLFKRKYESHLKSHENVEDIYHSEDVCIDEHPRFQETAKAVTSEIKCQICQTTFKLTIMLNRHNSHWHSDENPHKHLSMTDQKAKNEQPKNDLAVIKLLKCKHCLEAFIKPIELNEHLKARHNSEVDDQLTELNETQSSDELETNKNEKFICAKCKIVFHEKKFLENHQKFFCMHRHIKNDQVINEQ